MESGDRITRDKLVNINVWIKTLNKFQLPTKCIDDFTYLRFHTVYRSEPEMDAECAYEFILRIMDHNLGKWIRQHMEVCLIKKFSAIIRKIKLKLFLSGSFMDDLRIFNSKTLLGTSMQCVHDYMIFGKIKNIDTLPRHLQIRLKLQMEYFDCIPKQRFDLDIYFPSDEENDFDTDDEQVQGL